MIIRFNKNYATNTKKLVLSVLNEFGYEYDKKLDFDLEDVLKNYSIRNKSVFLLFLSNDDVIGTIALKKNNKKTCELKRFYVDKNFRRIGVGGKLFREFVKFAKKFQYEKVILDTTRIMISAIQFYEKCGFKKMKQDGEVVYYELDISKMV